MQIVEVEIGQSLPSLSARTSQDGHLYQSARALVTLHGYPLGCVDLRFERNEISPDNCAQHIWNALHDEITEHLMWDDLPRVSQLDRSGVPWMGAHRCGSGRRHVLVDPPLASVIICTRDHPDTLRRTLRAVAQQQYAHFEIVAVDNAPRTTATADMIHHEFGHVPNLRYILESQPGLSIARNRGIAEARGSIIAFTDDDTVPNPQWLTSLVSGFAAADKVACVTGLAFPLALDTPTQFWFEEFGGFNKGYAQRVFRPIDRHPDAPLYPYTAGRFGTGANMAFTSSFLREMGGFDPALGAGSLTGGGEDLDAFFQVITRGYNLVYEPDAVLYHEHRREYSALCKQIYDAGRGLTAYLAKVTAQDKARLFDIGRRLPYGVYFTFNPRSPKNKGRSRTYPKELARLEMRGMLTGLFAYVRARKHARVKGVNGPLSHLLISGVAASSSRPNQSSSTRS